MLNVSPTSGEANPCVCPVVTPPTPITVTDRNNNFVRVTKDGSTNPAKYNACLYFPRRRVNYNNIFGRDFDNDYFGVYMCILAGRVSGRDYVLKRAHGIRRR